MRADTVARIDDALVRLDAGKYGSCLECAREITERRLRALPFACAAACEELREQEHGRKQALGQRSATCRSSWMCSVPEHRGNSPAPFRWPSKPQRRAMPATTPPGSRQLMVGLRDAVRARFREKMSR